MNLNPDVTMSALRLELLISAISVLAIAFVLFTFVIEPWYERRCQEYHGRLYDPIRCDAPGCGCMWWPFDAADSCRYPAPGWLTGRPGPMCSHLFERYRRHSLWSSYLPVNHTTSPATGMKEATRA